MNLRPSSLIWSVVAAVLASTSAHADFNDKSPIKYTVDGASVSGYFKVVIEALNGIVRDAYPGTAATLQPGSPAGGILKISNGQADFNFTAPGAEIVQAVAGQPPFTESLKGKFKFVMLLHNSLVLHSMMTKEWAEKHQIKSFEDIAAKKPPMRLAVNTKGNLSFTLGGYQAIFDAYGIKEAEVTGNGGFLFHGNTTASVDAMRDGKIDVFINGAFVPSADILDLSRSRDLVWISSDADKAKVAASKWGFSTFLVKRDSYPFMLRDEITHTVSSAIIAGAHVPDETVYKLVKALAENEPKVRLIHPSLGGFEITSVSKNGTPLQYHPGAERYYREVGVLK